MITQKEKTAIEIIYEKSYKLSGEILYKTDALIEHSAGKLNKTDLDRMINHNNSRYIGWYGVTDSNVRITQDGISYVEGKRGRWVKEGAFWIFGISALIAGIYAMMTYYK
mgnify:CR=1 FL=1